jgi:predicted AlkP superfamily phosphohydrolase/phosphomutase
MSARVLLIGFDAAEKDLLLRWAQGGSLPTFRRLLDRSVWTVTQGPLGVPMAVWHSLFTGASPAQHGHHGSRQIRVGTYDSYRFMPRHIRHEPVWSTLSHAGRRVAVIDVPYVSPAADINGVHVVDWAPHAPTHGFATSPADVAERLVGDFGRDRIGLCDHRRIEGVAGFRAFRDALIERVHRKTALSRQLLAQERWDLFLTVFTECHCIGHHGWHLHDPGHPRHDPEIASALGDPLLEVYRALDHAVAEILELADEETKVFIVTSHGMGPYFNGDHLLGDVLFRLGHGPAPRRPTPIWNAFRWAWRRLPMRVRTQLMQAQKRLVDRTWPAFSREANCFGVPNGEIWSAIRINLVGREPGGRIAPGAEFESFCDTLADDLCALVNEQTGEPAVLRVVRSAEVFDGPYLSDLPDLLVEWSRRSPIEALRSSKIGTVRGSHQGPRSGHHKTEGALFAFGPGVRPGRLSEPVSVMDVSPTVAAALGVTLPGVCGTPIPACAGTTLRD